MRSDPEILVFIFLYIMDLFLLKQLSKNVMQKLDSGGVESLIQSLWTDEHICRWLKTTYQNHEIKKEPK